MTPTVGGTISSTFFNRYDASVRAALNSGTNPYVILDLVSILPCVRYISPHLSPKHNYARWNGQIINQGGPTDAQYASLWSQLAAKYKDNKKIIVSDWPSQDMVPLIID